MYYMKAKKKNLLAEDYLAQFETCFSVGCFPVAALPTPTSSLVCIERDVAFYTRIVLFL